MSELQLGHDLTGGLELLRDLLEQTCSSTSELVDDLPIRCRRGHPGRAPRDRWRDGVHEEERQTEPIRKGCRVWRCCACSGRMIDAANDARHFVHDADDTTNAGGPLGGAGLRLRAVTRP